MIIQWHFYATNSITTIRWQNENLNLPSSTASITTTALAIGRALLSISTATTAAATSTATALIPTTLVTSTTALALATTIASLATGLVPSTLIISLWLLVAWSTAGLCIATTLGLLTVSLIRSGRCCWIAACTAVCLIPWIGCSRGLVPRCCTICRGCWLSRGLVTSWLIRACGSLVTSWLVTLCSSITNVKKNSQNLFQYRLCWFTSIPLNHTYPVLLILLLVKQYVTV